MRLSDLIAPPEPKPAAKPPAGLSEIVAAPGFAPKAWQSTAPDTVWGSKPPVADSADLTRIIALPRRPQPRRGELRADALTQLITDRFARPNVSCRCSEFGRDCITTLRLTQAWALYEIGIKSGLLGGIGVGHGKTLLDILSPLALPCSVALLLVPPGLVSQLIVEYQLIGQHFETPSLIVHGRDWSNLRPGKPVLHVFPYSRLSRPEATSFLEQLRPDLVLADECHKLRHADTATTSRVLRYFAAHADTRFCGWSGSITDSSIKDYAHLAALALRYGSPLPLDPEVVEDWSRAIDPSDWPAPPGALLKLCEPGEHIHSGFHRRLVETAGVVITTEPAISAALRIDERKVSHIPADIQQALDGVRGTWQRPDGEELVEALAVARCARELACGFFYRWTFPRNESEELIVEWLAARKAWRRELREKLQVRAEHLDSPKLCALAAMRAWGDIEGNPELPKWKAETWPRWRAAKGTVQPETEAVRVNDYLARDAAAWGLEHRGVIWYEHRAFGAWVAELSGLTMHGGGPKAGELIAAEKGDRSIIASLRSHGTGRDGLQRLFNEQLVANPPSSATMWEQMLGRLHRIGQASTEVRGWFYRHTIELQEHVDKALARALYVQGTLGDAQKLRTGFKIPH